MGVRGVVENMLVLGRGGAVKGLWGRCAEGREGSESPLAPKKLFWRRPRQMLYI